MTKQELDKQVLEYTKNAMQDNGFTCCNCKYSKVFNLNDDEDAYQCSRDDWGGEVCLKHSLAYCSAFEFKEEESDLSEEDDTKATPDWEQMYNDLCIDYRQVCKDKAELKESYDNIFREMKIDEYALNDACILFRDIFNRGPNYILKLTEKFHCDRDTYIEIKNDLKSNAQDRLKRNGMIK